MFFDEARITVEAGKGGDGSLSFRREKYVPLGGPDGGNGGRGGHVFLRVNPQLNTLVSFRHKHRFVASDGTNGSFQRKNGANGSDLYISVPAGTVVRDAVTGDLLGDLTEQEDALLVARGGRGGRGNRFFKSPTRQAPRIAELGGPGDKIELTLELKLIADVGVVGKPNAGKSTLLSAVSAARPKIADYPFTTLSPNLGVVEIDGREFVMADIPGLIEGAHEGVGLGHEFLRHVERTRLLVHLLDGASLDPAEDFRVINRELALHSDKLAAKPQVVALNKADLPDAAVMLGLLREELGDAASQIHLISAVTGQGVRELLRVLASRLAELPREEPEEDIYVFRPQEQRESREFSILQEDEEHFRVRGQEIERLAKMTDWSSYEAMERFERIMIARGISEALELAGISLGDTVLIGELELEWR